MELQTDLISKFEEVLKKENNGKKTEIVNDKQLLLANEFYNKLLKTGVFKERGITLRGIEDIHLFNVKLNGYK